MSLTIGVKGRFAAFLEHVYKDGGDDYFSLPVHVIAELDPFWRTAAFEVGAVVMILAREENNFDPTSREIAARLESSRGQAEGTPPGHRSISFVQKGLAILDEPVVDERGEVVRPGLGLIDRIRRGGRRFIAWTKGLKPNVRGQKKDSPADPLCTPPPEERDKETTTTGGASSSSSEPGEEETDGPDPAAVWALYQRARGLLTEVTVGRVSHAVATYSADWVRKVLDLVEKRNRVAGNVKKPWGFARGWLENWRKEGGPPDDPEPPKAATKESKALKVDPTDRAREERLRAAWEALSESEREAIRIAVKAENPGIGRWKNMLEPLYLAELERRL